MVGLTVLSENALLRRFLSQGDFTETYRTFRSRVDDVFIEKEITYRILLVKGEVLFNYLRLSFIYIFLLYVSGHSKVCYFTGFSFSD